MPRKGERIGLLRTYRYPIEADSIEVPRGLVDGGESPEQAACREMCEETGYPAESCRHLGQIYADTGLIMRHIDVFVCDAGDRQASEHGEMEVIDDFAWKTWPELSLMIVSGQIRCGITLAALMLLRTASPE